VKIDKVVILYLVIIVLLIAGIVRLWPQKKNLSESGKTIKTTLDDLQGAETIIDDVKLGQMKAISVTGGMLKWDYQTGVLTIDIAGKAMDFVIDPINTKVLLGASQNKIKDKQLHGIHRDTQPLHWQHAFCSGDNIAMSLLGYKMALATSSDYMA
jgi:hypothetical protein